METAITKLLNGIYRVMPKMGNKARDNVFTLSLLLIFLMMFVDKCGLVSLRYLYCYSFGCFCLGMTVLASLRGEVAPVRFRRPTLYFWLLFALLQVVSALLNGVDYMADAVMLLVGFPIVYVAWGSMGIAHAFKLLRRAVIWSFLIMLPVNLILFPPTGTGYSGVFENQNCLALYLTVVFVCLLFHVFSEEKPKKCTLFIVLEGICVGLLYCTTSRNGQLASLVALIVFLVMEKLAGRLGKKQLRRLLILLLVCVLFCVILLPLMAATLYIPRMAFDRYNQFRLISIDDVQWGETLDRTKAKMQISGKNVNSLSSGRIRLWGSFIRALNWTGHAPGTEPPDAGHSTAHNYFLQVAYTHGILVGIISLALPIYMGILTLLQAIRRKSPADWLFTLVMSVAFGSAAMFEGMQMIYCYSTTFTYFLVQGTIFIQDSELPSEVNKP